MGNRASSEKSKAKDASGKGKSAAKVAGEKKHDTVPKSISKGLSEGSSPEGMSVRRTFSH